MDTRSNSFFTDAARDAVIELRHAMHREPELSNAEWKTQERIRGILQRFGIHGAKVFHNTFLHGVIGGAASGTKRSIAVRGDIDALPVKEARDDLSCRSQVDGVMHACGHDVHASIALGTALALHRGCVRISRGSACVLSAGRGGGAAWRASARTYSRASAVPSASTSVPTFPSAISTPGGTITRSADEFKLIVTGEMAHGATAHQGVDAIIIAAAFINEVQKVVSREMPIDDGA
ncbi:M20/M25/M40 family metallo-hydrolase [Bradyrhizobium sp. TZ2]